ncbi:MAG TPA: ISNCY family transposase [Candidatus Competibacteraceae bacterium]|nr:ISNCY family transposase [Candidatus Competibacteraceae bacterium]
MSVPFGPFVLTLDDITQQIRRTFEQFTDPRQGKNTRYTLVDAGLSAFSVFFMQSPSFLEYQRSLEQALGRNNAQTLFGVHHIPSDNQIRHLLDSTAPSQVTPVFSYLFQGLYQAGVIDRYRAVNQTLLLALDGTEYFSSRAIHGPNCSARRHANGQVTYFHTVLTPVLVKPGVDKVIPLVPAYVQPQDGAEKQDCELNAAKRWLADWSLDYSPLNVTLLGDDLYCHEPFCRDVLNRGWGFIFVCKPESHATVYEWLEFLQRGGAVNTVVRRRWTGQRREFDTYRYAVSIPLRDGEDALLVNWCELTTTGESGKVLYHNAFTTSLPLKDQNVAKVAEAGRSRWKIENENNNTLKTKGYHFEHNYGHGQQYLSSLLASLILLAFLVHTVLEWMADQYQLLRQKLPSRKRLFSDIRTLTSYLCFESWEALMTFMLQSFYPVPSKPATG